VLRALAAALGASGVVAAFVFAINSLGAAAPEFVAPKPTGGTWCSEVELGPPDDVIPEPTLDGISTSDSHVGIATVHKTAIP